MRSKSSSAANTSASAVAAVAARQARQSMRQMNSQHTHASGGDVARGDSMKSVPKGGSHQQQQSQPQEQPQEHSPFGAQRSTSSLDDPAWAEDLQVPRSKSGILTPHHACLVAPSEK